MPRVGEQPVPGYKLLTPLGRGGLGEVWKASGPGGISVALKFINLQGGRGLRELRAMRVIKEVHHPHLVPIIAFWLKDMTGSVVNEESQITSHGASELYSELVIAMTLAGQDLFSRLQECQAEGLQGIPREELLPYVQQAALAIDYLNEPRHDLGRGPVAIHHGDIKPQNIMLTGGVAQVCDFGLASVLGELRSTGSGSWTPAYAAPEIVSGKPPAPTTDQYSLAITYYELATGKLPYSSTNRWAVEQAIREGNLDLSAATPEEQAVLRRATHLDPARRFGSCQELVAALQEAVFGAARPPLPWLRWCVHAAAVVALLLAVPAAIYRDRLHGPLDPALIDQPTDPRWQQATQQEAQGRGRLAEARKLAAQQHWRQAVAPLDAAIESFDAAVRSGRFSFAGRREHAAAHYLRGQAELKAGNRPDYQLALLHFGRATHLEPARYASHVGWATALLNLARQEYEAGVALKFQSLDAESQGRFRTGLSLYRRAIEQHSQYVRAEGFMLGGMCAHELMDFDLALAWYDRALAAQPTAQVRCYTHYRRAAAYRELRQWREAMAAYRDALNQYPPEGMSQPARWELAFGMAACNEELEDWPGALQACSQAVDLFELDPNTPESIFLLKTLHAQRQAYAEQSQQLPLAEAERRLIDLLERLWSAPRNASLWRQLGTLLTDDPEPRLRHPRHAHIALAFADELERP
jgi:tetratricopeptide (TPR) repeat protein